MARERRKGKEFSPATKVKAYERSGGKCESCGVSLKLGKINYDHAIAIGLGGDNSLANCVVLCLPCHGEKTHGQDNPIMRKADAQHKAEIGATRAKRQIANRRKPERPPRDKLELPPRRPMFVDKN
jgi:5-methylcytosine-specific restriction protein A